MKLQDSKERICNLLKDTIITFCKNFVSFNFALNLEGIIVITSDGENVLVIKLDETHNVQTKDVCNQQSNTMPSRSATTSKLLSINKSSHLNTNRQLALQYPHSGINSSSARQPKVRQRVSLSARGGMPIHQPMNMAFRPRMTAPRVRGQRAGRGMCASSRGSSARGATNARPRAPSFRESNAMVPFNGGFRSALVPVAGHGPRMPGSFVRQMAPAPGHQKRVQAAICSPDSRNLNNNPVPLLAICDVGSNVTIETTNVAVFDEMRDKMFADIVSNALSKLDEKPDSVNLTKILSPKMNSVDMPQDSSKTGVSKVENNNNLHHSVHLPAAVQQPKNSSVGSSQTSKAVLSPPPILSDSTFNSMSFSTSSRMNVNSTIANNQISPPSYNSVCQVYRPTAVTKPSKNPSRLQIALVPAKKPGQLLPSNSCEFQSEASINFISSSGSRSHPNVSPKTVRVASLITLPKTSPVSSMQLVPLTSFAQQNQGVFRSPNCSFYQAVPTNERHSQIVYGSAQQKSANQIQSSFSGHQFSNKTSQSQQICQPRNSMNIPKQNQYVSPQKSVMESQKNYFNYMPQNTLKPGQNQQMLLNASNFTCNMSNPNLINSPTIPNQGPTINPHMSTQRTSECEVFKIMYGSAEQKSANQIQSSFSGHQFSNKTSQSQKICQPRNLTNIPKQNQYVSPQKSVMDSQKNFFNYMPQNTLKPGQNQQMLLNASNFTCSMSNPNLINSPTIPNQGPTINPHMSTQRTSECEVFKQLISGPLTFSQTGVNVCNPQTTSPFCRVLSPQKLLNHYPQFVSGYNSFQPFNSCDKTVVTQLSLQDMQNSHQNVQLGHHNFQPSCQNVQPSQQNVPLGHHNVQHSHQIIQSQNVQTDCQNLQPIHQTLQQTLKKNQQIVLPNPVFPVYNIPQQCDLTPDFPNISNVSSVENIRSVNNYKSLDVSLDSQISAMENLQNLSILEKSLSSSLTESTKALGNLGTDQEKSVKSVLEERKLPPLRLKNLGDGSMVVMDPSSVTTGEGHISYNNTEDSNVLQDLHEYAISQVMKAVEGLKKDTHLPVGSVALESNSANKDKNIDISNLLSDVSGVVSQSCNVEPSEHYSILDVSQNIEIASHGTISNSVSTASLLETAEKSLLDSFSLGLAEDVSDMTETPDDVLNQDLNQDQHTCQACFINMDSIVMLAEHYSQFHTVPSVHWREKDVAPHMNKMKNYNAESCTVLVCPFLGCRRSFSLLKGLASHYSRSHKCKLTSKQLMLLKKQDGSLQRCNICQSKFINKKTLTEHISRVHGSIHTHV